MKTKEVERIARSWYAAPIMQEHRSTLMRHIAVLAGPVMMAMLTQTIINQIDHILVGHLPNGEATPGQTAVQISQIYLWMFGGMLASIAVGTQTLTARRHGEGQPEQAGAVATNSLLVSLVASIVVGALCWLAAPVLMKLVSKDETVRSLGIPFVRWRFINIPGMVLFAALKAFFDAIGKTWVALVGALLMNCTNLILCVVLMYGTASPGLPGIDAIHRTALAWAGGTLPRLGVPGAGMAAMISSYLGLGVLLICALLLARRPYVIFRGRNFSWTLARKLATLSLPSGLATLFGMSGFAFVVLVVGKVDKLAGHGPGRTIFSTATSNIINVLLLIFMSCIGFGTATATLVSQQLGAKKPEKAKRYVHLSVLMGVVFYGCLGVFIFAFAPHILRIWNPGDMQVLAIATPILRVLCFMMPFFVTAIVFTQALYGAGNTRFVMIVELILHFVCLIPLCYALAIWFHLGIWGAWAAMILYVVLLAGTMFLKFRSGTWQHIQL